MTVTLEKLGGDTRNSFIEKLKESFDAFVEENPGTPEGPVISCGEIEASLIGRAPRPIGLCGTASASAASSLSSMRKGRAAISSSCSSSTA